VIVGHVETEGERIIGVGEPGALLVVPGFVDLQLNGGFGIDLATEPERLWELAARLPRAGVTSFLPTIVTSPPGVIERAQASLAARPPAFVGAEPVGLHLEGPMLALAGAHDPALLRPFDLDDLTGIAMVTLAPELPGADEVIARLRAAGVVVAAGHTATTELSGVDGVTHVFNAMAPFHHRSPGPVGAALTDDGLFVTIVADGAHVDPVAVRLVERAVGERLVLVSDAVAEPTLPLNGGRCLLDQAVRNLAAWTGSPERAIAAATSAPARAARLADRGVLRPGALADLVVLSPDLHVRTTITRGEVSFRQD
jgi:N-acetylglucosamine-6-phosphate deacetylase